MTQAKYIRVASDLHIESQYGRAMGLIERDFLPRDEKDAESILVLVGDISSSIQQLFDFIQLVEQRFVAVIFVPGNHEFYHQEIFHWKQTVDTKFKGLFKTYWATLGVESVRVGGLVFIFGTLWGDGGGSIGTNHSVEHGLNDFRLIRKNFAKFSVRDMIAINREHIADIKDLLDENDAEKVVVVTHHLPSHSLCPPRFGHSINGGFAASCDYLMADGHPRLWIHGHTHDTIDTNLYGTRIVCNPFGYKYESNKSEFNTYSNKFIEIATL